MKAIVGQVRAGDRVAFSPAWAGILDHPTRSGVILVRLRAFSGNGGDAGAGRSEVATEGSSFSRLSDELAVVAFSPSSRFRIAMIEAWTLSSRAMAFLIRDLK